MGNWDYSGRKSGEPKPYTGYAYQDLTVSGAVVDYSLKDNSNLFAILTTPVKIVFSNGSSDISIKLNSTSNDAISIVGNAEKEIADFAITDIYITTSGDSSFGIFTLGWR